MANFSAAYKFAKDVLPLMLADAASGQPQPLEPAQPAPAPQPVQAPMPPSDPNQAQNIPQGPTAVTAAPIQAPQELATHELAPAQKAAAALRVCTLGALDLVMTKQALRNMASAQLAKEAGWASGAMNFGRGALAVTKPLTGLVRGGMRGAGAGTLAAAKTIMGSPAAAAGAATAAYTGYKTLRNPVVEYGDGFKLQSPIRIPAARMQMPVTWAGNGPRFQPMFKTLW
jgi:hypothetical protein